MPVILNKILKFLLGFSLAILLSGFVYNYFPSIWQEIKETKFFTAALSNSLSLRGSEPVGETDEVILTQENASAPRNDEVLFEQDKLDDLADQIDIIRRQIDDLIESKKPKQVENEKIKDKEEKELEEKDLEDEVDEENEQIDLEEKDFQKEQINYPQILISEVRIDTIDQRFIKLYNPNNYSVDLTGWYLQRKTQNAQSWSSLVTSTKFANLKIIAYGYFLISRNLPNSDILEDITLSNNNYLVLKNPNRDIVHELNLSSIIAPIVSSGGGGGSIETTYDKILISEVKIAEKTGDKNIFLELYNPNNKEVDLIGWYIFRNNTSFITKTMFDGKKIPANGYFLISKTESLWQDSSDLQFDGTLNEDDNIALKNPKGDIADLVSWSKVAESLTWGRKDNTEDFELQIPTPKAQNITFVEPPIVEIPKDITPPEVIFGLLPAIQTELSFNINFEITDLLDTVTPSGVGSFIFKWKEGENDWQEDVEENFTANPIIKDFTGEDQKTYYFQVKAKDIAENWSNWLPDPPVFTTIDLLETTTPTNLPIVINEIQISPIEKRFVELYNPNLTSIDLTGYYLQRKRQDNDSWDTFVSAPNFEGKIIEPNSYFLISREIIGSDILLNIALKDNESLALKNPERDIIDKVGWGQAIDVEGTPTLTPLEEKSISRIQGVDTNDNSKDFVILDTPTPKSE